jgi:hypothetical protein
MHEPITGPPPGAGCRPLPVLSQRVGWLEVAAIGVQGRQSADTTASQVDRAALAVLGRDLLDVAVVQV